MDDEIDLMELITRIWKKKWIIFLVTVMFMIAGAYVSIYHIEPVYETNVNIIIGKDLTESFDEDEYTDRDVSMYLQVVKTYEEIAKSRAVVSRVEEILNDDELTQVKSVTVSSMSDTQVITIIVTDDTLANIELYANTYAEQFIQVANEVLPAGQLTILDRAQRPDQPISPSLKKNLAIAGLLGMVLSGGIIVLKDFLNKNIVTEKDLENCFNSPILYVLSQDKSMKRKRNMI